jgi:hypothetical protein
LPLDGQTAFLSWFPQTFACFLLDLPDQGSLRSGESDLIGDFRSIRGWIAANAIEDPRLGRTSSDPRSSSVPRGPASRPLDGSSSRPTRQCDIASKAIAYPPAELNGRPVPLHQPQRGQDVPQYVGDVGMLSRILFDVRVFSTSETAQILFRDAGQENVARFVQRPDIQPLVCHNFDSEIAPSRNAVKHSS